MKFQKFLKVSGLTLSVTVHKRNKRLGGKVRVELNGVYLVADCLGGHLTKTLQAYGRSFSKAIENYIRRLNKAIGDGYVMKFSESPSDEMTTIPVPKISSFE